MSKKEETKTDPQVDQMKRDEETAKRAEKDGALTENLDASEEDALGVKKNVVGENRDEAGPDMSPTTEDVHDDLEKNLEDARNEGYRNGVREREGIETASK